MQPNRCALLMAAWLFTLYGVAQDELKRQIVTPNDPEGFIQVLPPDIKWLPIRTIQGGQVAILLGDPDKSGPVVVRLKIPPHFKGMPHTHPDARTYTVLSGESKLGFGNRFDPTLLKSFPAGSLYRLPAGVIHFQATGSREAIVQIQSIGPNRTDFLPQN